MIDEITKKQEGHLEQAAFLLYKIKGLKYKDFDKEEKALMDALVKELSNCISDNRNIQYSYKKLIGK